MEKKNIDMKEIADQQINDNKSASQQSKIILKYDDKNAYSEHWVDQWNSADQREISEKSERATRYDD